MTRNRRDYTTWAIAVGAMAVGLVGLVVEAAVNGPSPVTIIGTALLLIVGTTAVVIHNLALDVYKRENPPPALVAATRKRTSPAAQPAPPTRPAARTDEVILRRTTNP